MTGAIETLRVHRIEVPLVRPFVTAVRTATSIAVTLVEAVDSDGRSGWGEAPISWRVTGESPESVRAAVLGPLAEAVVGGDPADLAVLVGELPRRLIGNAAARSAVDCALHDLAAQQAGLPLYVYLGGAVGTVRTDMTLSAGPVDELGPEAFRWSQAGFGTLKVKAGAGHDDVEVLRAVRDAVGPDVRLRVDANQGWAPREAVRIITAWEDAGLDVEFVEQPVSARSPDDLEFVSSQVHTPILADEAAWTSCDLLEIVKRRAADLVNVKLAKSGGLLEAQRMIAVAQSSGVGVLVGSMMESHVGIAAAASLAASAGVSSGEARRWGTSVRDASHDLDAGLWLADSPVSGGVDYRGDLIVLSGSGGLGIRGLAGSEE